MKQFTMNIDETLLLAAKRRALEQGRSVSDIVREALAREIGWAPHEPKPSVDDASNLPALLGYSQGKLTRRQAMNAMGLRPDLYSEFVDAMIRSQTPWPAIDRARVEAEGEVVVQAISGVMDED